MSNTKHLKTEIMDCPICGQTHEVGLYSRMTQINIKGENVEYEQQYYKCDNTDPTNDEHIFCPGGLWQQNIDRARAAYAKKTNKEGNSPRLAQDFAKDYCSLTPGNRKIIIKDLWDNVIWTGKIKDLQHLQTEEYWIVTHYLSGSELGNALGIIVDRSTVNYADFTYEEHIHFSADEMEKKENDENNEVVEF